MEKHVTTSLPMCLNTQKTLLMYTFLPQVNKISFFLILAHAPASSREKQNQGKQFLSF